VLLHCSIYKCSKEEMHGPYRRKCGAKKKRKLVEIRNCNWREEI
jgi:hypothetical protein